MKRIPLIILSIVILSSLAAAGVFAQSGETTALDENSASLSIVEAVPVIASIEVTLNGESYTIAIPATVNIDVQKSLTEALLTTQAVDHVGDLRWKITAIEEYGEEFDLSRYSTIEPSSVDNKLVVIRTDLTNLDSSPFTYWLDSSERLAYDDLGNLYDASDQECDDINPGDTKTCTFVFDVPETVNILGMDVKVYDHKRIPFVPQE